MQFKYMIVDDEPMARKLILNHMQGIEGFEFCGDFGNAKDAGNALRARQIDLIFLDIQMPELNGLKFIESLKTRPSVIFTTAFREYAADAFEVDAVDYLLKPISLERLLKAVNKFFEKQTVGSRIGSTTADPESIYIKSDRKIHKILLSEIILIESLDEYIKIYLNDRQLISRETISSLAAKLPQSLFVRIHRSYIVSISSISSVSADGIEIGKKLVPFGRAFKSSAIATLKLRNI